MGLRNNARRGMRFSNDASRGTGFRNNASRGTGSINDASCGMGFQNDASGNESGLKIIAAVVAEFGNYDGDGWEMEGCLKVEFEDGVERVISKD